VGALRWVPRFNSGFDATISILTVGFAKTVCSVFFNFQNMWMPDGDILAIDLKISTNNHA
jgi:hypothetical protein